ncbi:hypothetical protein P153DRAFT_432278 [Dothidotthia symphoricarpi CBS 119687]|uniref:F-box domain-containing protein n=1 Tax=Dothidotthia symphoricarpi CBS 119687 TaxID=1392245 RepID=A0A6A6AD60_9PLEO|nr:uncharacterized protein P153DRAFT_432278 [Dothidotthia symphoricarpi CBS 119687]KAF2128681.1 hypothetical protein P153DRAFT_432278 [Dothidotthia symphoricarpi CBS 119687]
MSSSSMFDQSRASSEIEAVPARRFKVTNLWKKIVSSNKPSLAQSGLTGPCSFMGLPPELRLMIYERLGTTWTQHTIAVEGFRCHISVCNPSVPVRILATCRQVHSEALEIMKRKMLRLHFTRPKIIIDIRTVWRLMHAQTRLKAKGDDFLDTILQGVRLAPNSLRHLIMQYRDGRLPVEDLRAVLNIKRTMGTSSLDATRAFSSFILRAAKHIEYWKASLGVDFKIPMDMVIEIPYTSGCPYIDIKVFPRWIFQSSWLDDDRRRYLTEQARCYFVVSRLAHYAMTKCVRWSSMPIVVSPKYSGDSSNGMAPRYTEDQFFLTVDYGLQIAGRDDWILGGY